MSRLRRLLLFVAVSVPATLSAQDAAAPPTQKERISFVYFAPERLGVLLPMSDRWMVRADVAGNSFHTEEPRDYLFHEYGFTLIRRSAPSARGWSYGAFRYAIANASGSLFEDPYVIHTLSLAVGGHGQVIDWLGAFGEVGPSFSYHQDDLAIGGGTRIITYGSLETRIGVTLRRPLMDASARPSAERVPAPGKERPSWIFGGVGDGGVLIPVTNRWMLRPDLAADVFSFRPGDSDTHARLGLSLLRRSTGFEYGWVYSALRYGLTYDQYYSGEPDISHVVSLTVGAHLRLTDRLGVFAEAGPFVRLYDQETSAGTFDARNIGIIHGVGLSYTWKDRAR